MALAAAAGRAAEPVEVVPRAELAGVAAAAAGTLRDGAGERASAGRAVGQRVLRDALLDHVAMVVTPDAGGRAGRGAQRLVQAVVRMGFLGPAEAAGGPAVRGAGGRPLGRAWSGPYGVGLVAERHGS